MRCSRWTSTIRERHFSNSSPRDTRAPESYVSERKLASGSVVIAAIASSFRNLQVPPETAVFGEVGLTGEVRGVLQAQARAREAQTLGFKKLILPESNKKGLEKLLGIRVIGVKSLEQAMDALF